MAKRIFFSFDYQDVIDLRANIVRNHWLTKSVNENAAFFDASIWELEKATEETTLKRIINKALQDTSVTVVLIGSETYRRRWVRYEIVKSLLQGNHIVGVHINSIKDKHEKTKPLGPNPFDYVGYQRSDDGTKLSLYECKNQRWVLYREHVSYSLKTDVPLPIHDEIFPLSSNYPVYDWIVDAGHHNFAKWVG